MRRESYWLRWNRLQRLFRADMFDWGQMCGAELTGKRLLDLEAICDKLIQDTKNLAAEELDTIRSYEEIVDIVYEETSHRLSESNQDRAVRAVEPGRSKGVEGEKHKPIQFRK